MKRKIIVIISVIVIISIVGMNLFDRSINRGINKSIELSDASNNVENNENGEVIEALDDEILTENENKQDKNQEIQLASTNNKQENKDEYIEQYFDKYKEVSENNDKDNMLIVISDKEIENTYGAKDIIKAPNNQYILQYESTEKKDSALNDFKEDNSIFKVEENIKYEIEETDYNSWGIESMALDHAIDSSDTDILEDVTVAIIDTGCDLQLFNSSFTGKITETYNVLENSTTSMEDERGHGTHIAGTIAEATPSNVKIFPVKASRDGGFYNTDIVTAINYIVYNEKADVINMSFGSYVYSDVMDHAISYANENNIICVAAAGNDNTNKKHYPSSLDNTISIASVDSELNKSGFSNYGSDITFAAPGTNILSINGTKSGTSMATPHAVSAVAILKSYNKNLSLEDVIEVLKLTSVDLGEKGWDEYFGYGLISFADTVFRDDDINTDEYNIYKVQNKQITNIELSELILTQYNYYSITNLLGSKINVYYSDNSSEEVLLCNLPDLEILNYEPRESGQSQTITISTGDISINVDVTNPNDYESGWEYREIQGGSDTKLEITGYKGHGLDITKLYVPLSLDSCVVAAFADNTILSNISNDFYKYEDIYLTVNMEKIGDYVFSASNVRQIYGEGNEIKIGAHAFESCSLETINIPITEIGDSAFKDDTELKYIDITENIENIPDYAFYNCKKLRKVDNANGTNYISIDSVGKYAFYDCVSLANVKVRVLRDINEYAFYNCFSLFNFALADVNELGEYSFYGTSILEARLTLVDEISQSAFENCKRLQSVRFTSGRIESRAFWGSGVETIFIGSLVDYIADDAFAYCPVKTCDGGTTDGKYYCMSQEGIIESDSNKLMVGFTDGLYEINKISESVTEIGDYAFTGNNRLKTIIIPENVTKIGDYAFKDCYQLSNIYILGNSMEFGNETFKKTYEGEVDNIEAYIYIHKDSYDLGQYIVSKNYNYRHIEPDEIVVHDPKTVYRAYEEINKDEIIVKLIYHEEEDREEILSKMNNSIRTILTNKSGVGFTQSSGTIKYGDTCYTLMVVNKHGYVDYYVEVPIQVIKAIPEYRVPNNLTAEVGQQLLEVTLPKYFEWMNGDQTITRSGKNTFKARYVPADINNYEIVENINIIVDVQGESDLNPLKGDINKDGNITLYDAFTILRKIILEEELTEEEIYIMDISNDGQTTIYDAFTILKQAIME